MCGLVGYVGLTTPAADMTKLQGFLWDALYVDTLRGADATGIALGRNGVVTELVKHAIAGPQFLELKSVITSMKDHARGHGGFAMGHNRAATSGGATSASAHPFQAGTVTLIHNGTLWQDWKLPEHPETDVDSAKICQAFATREPTEKCRTEILEALDGDYALVWHDRRDNTMNFARNENRPLSFARVWGEDAIVYASEEHMLRFLLHRNLDTTLAIEEFAVGRLYSLDLNGLETVFNTSSFTPLEMEYGTWRKGQGTGMRVMTPNKTQPKGKKKKNKEQAPTAGGQREELSNAYLKGLGANQRVGSIVGVYAGEWKPYESTTHMGVVEGWADLEWEGKARFGSIQVRLHQVPKDIAVQATGDEPLENLYIETLRGYIKAALLSGDDPLLILSYTGVGRNEEASVYWKEMEEPVLHEFFEGNRRRYDSKDLGTIALYCDNDPKAAQVYVTRRELDEISRNTKCSGCKAPPEMVEYKDTFCYGYVYTEDEETNEIVTCNVTWVCAKCHDEIMADDAKPNEEIVNG
jgi:hypothetical protein